MTNPTVEIHRRRNFERFKTDFVSTVTRLFASSPKFSAVTVPPQSILERWHFACKLEESLSSSSSSSFEKQNHSEEDTKGFKITPTQQIVTHVIQSNQQDPIFISPSSFIPDNTNPEISPITTTLAYKLLLQELIFQYKREHRRNNKAYKTEKEIREEEETFFNSKKFINKLKSCIYSLRDLSEEMDLSFGKEMMKQASMEHLSVAGGTLSRTGKKKKKKKSGAGHSNVPKLSIHYQMKHVEEKGGDEAFTKKRKKISSDSNHQQQQKEEEEVVKLTYNGLSFNINKTHYDKLYILFQRCHPPPPSSSAINTTNTHKPSSSSNTNFSYQDVFKSHLYTLLCRYDTLQGCGLQSSLNPYVFDTLYKLYGCAFECFASPFNCRYDSFCSAFGSSIIDRDGSDDDDSGVIVGRDVDAAFGSCGSFFDYNGFQYGGCFQANPPFVSTFIERMYLRMELFLSSSSSPDNDSKTTKKQSSPATTTPPPLMFIIFIPAWTETSGWNLINDSPYKTHHLLLSQKNDTQYYCEGTQHRRTSGRYRISSFDTSVFFLQNEVGRKKWVVTEEHVMDIKSAFAKSEDDDDEKDFDNVVGGGCGNRMVVKQKKEVAMTSSTITNGNDNMCETKESTTKHVVPKKRKLDVVKPIDDNKNKHDSKNGPKRKRIINNNSRRRRRRRN